MKSADVIVVGLGGMGSAAAWRLAQRGARVLAFEQFQHGHNLGSSHGHTRIIRQAYYEHPAYVPLVRRAYSGWYELEQAAGELLLAESTCLSLGPSGSELVQGVRRSAAEHSLDVENLSPAAVMRRYPAFRLPAEFDAVLERTAGVLLVDRCVRALAEQARRLGADLRHERVVSWSATGGVEVTTERGRYSAGHLVLTAGPWLGALLPGEPLRVMRQVVFWFRPAGARPFDRGAAPIFIAETPAGYFYGLPAFDARGPKIARHYGAPELTTPEEVAREVSDADEAPVREFMRGYLPGADGPRSDAGVCLYTLTPDRHFLLGPHPDQTTVAVAGGFSGHGFKFAPVVGEILADLALEGKTSWPIGWLAPGRFA